MLVIEIGKADHGMQTKLYTMTETTLDQTAIEDCAAILRAGGLVAFPTETVYGLGASAFEALSCARIFEVKHRPADKPLLCHLASLEQAEELAYLTDTARALICRYTPGPLTLVLKKKALRTGYCFRRRRYGWTALSRQPHLPRASAGLRVPGRCTVGQSLVAPQSGYGHAGDRFVLRRD